jgi:hypothetical protein
LFADIAELQSNVLGCEILFALNVGFAAFWLELFSVGHSSIGEHLGLFELCKSVIKYKKYPKEK